MKLKLFYSCFSVIIGFKSTQVTTLVNTALVPMTFKLRVPNDGHSKVVSVTNGDDTLGKTNVNVAPKEFEIQPESGTIPPQSEMKIAVSLSSYADVCLVLTDRSVEWDDIIERIRQLRSECTNRNAPNNCSQTMSSGCKLEHQEQHVSCVF